MKNLKIVFLALVAMPINVLAFELFPMVQFSADSGNRATTFFKVTNTSLVPLPIEVTAVKRHVVFNNEETLNETDDLLVFPPQVLIAPGKSQSIKVQYIGNVKQSAESYRVIVSQLPLKSDSDNDSVQMLFRIGALLFISPPNVQEQYVSEIILDKSSVPNLRITNTGSSVIELDKQSYNVTWGGEAMSWNWQQVEPLLPMQYLVPNQSAQVNAQPLLTQ
ncbi:molecular chaperone [Vibrio sinensis]|uniref:Molecular chaperone n=1 Tax=Vibrio sinensis TaxID=2302434 RepID=A0A3A6QWD7_9VIBR|nr:fimbria/pilus periplasmic chaperone [Vibrio sinensis]RJX75588.1 molecular chaperone [Vibrio sinensis]